MAAGYETEAAQICAAASSAGEECGGRGAQRGRARTAGARLLDEEGEVSAGKHAQRQDEVLTLNVRVGAVEDEGRDDLGRNAQLEEGSIRMLLLEHLVP